MKKTILIILALALSFAASYAAKWESYGPSNSPYYITSINGVNYCSILKRNLKGNPVYDFFRSSDKGLSWNKIVELHGYSGKFFYLDDKVILLSSNSAYESNDTGKTWLNSNLSKGMPNIQASCNINDTVYSIDNKFVYMSTDNAITRQTIKKSMVKNLPTSMCVLDDVIFTSGYSQIFKGGKNDSIWTALSIDTTLALYQVDVATNGTVVMAYSKNKVYISTDKGLNWMQFAIPNNEIISCCFNGNEIWICNTYGIYYGSILGSKWVKSNLGVGNAFASLVSANPGIVASIDNNAEILISSDNGKVWEKSLNSISYPLFAIATSGDTIFAGSSKELFFQSVDKGKTYQTSKIKNGSTNSISYVDGIIYIGDDRGTFTKAILDTVWKELPGGYGSNDNSFFKYEGNIYGVMGSYMIKSTDKGLSWNIICKDSFYAVKYCINDGNFFVARPPYKLDILTSDFRGVFKSSDKGLTWDTVNTGLPYLSITGLSAKDGNIFCSGLGVYMSSNNGESWISINDSLVNSYVEDLSSNSEYLFAATSLSYVGVARLKLPSSLPGVVLEYPYNQSTQININTPLRWYSVGEALRYTMQISKDPNFASLVSEQECVDSLFNITGLENYTKYYWRVKATFGAVKGPWSEVFNFTTGNINKVEELTATHFSVSPNPASQSLNLDYNFSEQGDLSITLYNVVGEKVLELNGMATAGRQNLDVSKLTAGAYQVVFEISGKKLYYPVTIVR